MYILSSFILLLLYNNTFLWAIYFAILLFVASCHCCASDPVLPFKEDFMGCTVSLFSSLSALPLSLLLCGMFLLFSLMHIETAYWIVSFSAFLLALIAIFKFYQRRNFSTFMDHKLISSPKLERLHPSKLVCMHVISTPTCMNFLSRF